jgi:3-hydroxyisobutyrate dehydrogenase-like beta-hydroxyacid dehydrogenase
MMATGFIGLGDMGAPIAHRLLDGCIELVVFDVRAEAGSASRSVAACSNGVRSTSKLR